MPADQVVSAVPERQRHKKRPRPPRNPQTPKIVELLHRAQEWRRQLDAGEVESQADIARREGLTRARVTQVLSLLNLAPSIQDYILSMPKITQRPAVTERSLRPIVQMNDHKTQLKALSKILV